MSGDSEAVEPEGVPEASQGTTLEWTVRMWEREPKKLVVILLVACMAGALGMALLHHPVGAALGFLMIGGATTDYWLPQKFTIDGTGASLRCGISVTSLAWADVQRVVVADEGVKLSPLADSSRLSPFRGVYLRFARNRDEVIGAIQSHWEGDVRSLEG